MHETGKTKFWFPGASIPKWFDHQSKGPSRSFWFRKRFPAKVLCILIAPVDMNFDVRPMVFINGNDFYHGDNELVRMLKLDHTYLFYLQVLHFDNNLFEVPLEKEWNRVEVTYAGVLENSIIKATGIHVFKQENSMEDIRLVDPFSSQS